MAHSLSQTSLWFPFSLKSLPSLKSGLGHSGRCEVRLEFAGRVSLWGEGVKT